MRRGRHRPRARHRLGHQFQLRTAVPLGRRVRTCRSSPVPVAHCRSFRSLGPGNRGRTCRWSPVPVAHCRSFLFVAIPDGRGHQFQLRIERSFRWSCGVGRWSPVPVAHRALLPLGASRGHLGHQFQLRIGRLLPWSGRVECQGGRRRGVSGRRHAVGGMQEPPPDEPEGARPSPVVGSTVITAGTGLRNPLSPPPSAPPVTGDTSVVARLRSADQRDEPRMNGRGVLEVRGCVAVTA
jgi:hypothetical protein